MNAFHRLHSLRMENDAAGFAMDELRPRFSALSTRHEDATAPRAVSAFQLFQTPPELAARLVGCLGLKPGARVLEPSAGLGRILDALKPHTPAEVVAVELSPKCTGELFRQNREGVTILQRDFLTVSPDEIGEFDAVVMNPPFHLRADVRHIQHAMRFLKRGGTLAALCMATHHREQAFRHLSETWEAIPARSFSSEGTNVATFMLTIQEDV